MTDQPQQPDAARPLCVDLDGTLVSTDTMLESILRLLRRRPWTIVTLLIWMTGGLVSFKRKLIARGVVDPAKLPWRQDVIDYVRAQRDAGRVTVLATASNVATAMAVAEYLQCFDCVIATDAEENLRGRTKVRAIRKQLETNTFDYVGDSHRDIPVWAEATQAILVSPTRRVERLAQQRGNVAQVFRRQGEPYTLTGAIRRSVRPAGALTILACLLAAKAAGVLKTTWPVAAALCVSGACLWAGLSIVRDLLSLTEDRAHHRRKLRPIAAGHWSLSGAIKTAAALLAAAAAAFAAAWALS